MAIRYKALTELYQETQRSVTAPDQWRAFLASACRNYRLSFDEQLLVYAQRPDATAVLEIERWNRQFGRWVNRGANGIAVFDGEHNGKPRLKYYFDISDTHEARFPRPVPLWTVREEYAPDIIETLENSFGELERKEDLGEALLSAAKNAVEDNIDQEILDYCVQTGRIYESRNKGHSNVVFVGFDKDGKARFGCLRGISEARFHGDLSGSDKHFSFALPACVENPAVHLCECAIDVMSYATLCKLDGIDWRRHNLLSLAGVYQPKKKMEESKLPVALTRFLDDHPHVKTVYLHLDNDTAGRLAAKAIMAVMPEGYRVENKPPPRGKDVNDFLCHRLGIPIRGSHSKEPER